MIDEIKTEAAKLEADFTGFVKTLELKFFKGKLHQKSVAGHPGATPDHVWLPIESHDTDAPAAGEAIVAESVEQSSEESESEADSKT